MRVMYDSVSVGDIPADARAVAGYVDGNWPTFKQLRRFHANRLSIAVHPDADAACLDIENGDATPADAPAWVHRQIARGQNRPVIYASRDTILSILQVLERGQIHRGDVRIWSAHYGQGPHICSPHACGAPFTADGTQWTDTALGRNLDESLLADDFFPAAPKRHRLPKPKLPKPKGPHPKTAAAGGAGALLTIIIAALHAAGVHHITPAEYAGATGLAALVAAAIAPRNPKTKPR